MIKKIEDWNHYELLDIDPEALPDDIHKAYQRTLEAYRKGSLATYGLISDKERETMLGRIKQAYEVLSSQRKRSQYDAALFSGNGKVRKSRARFRRTLEKVEIEDAVPPSSGFWLRLRNFFRRKKD